MLAIALAQGPAPPACSLNGELQGGTCVCDKPWSGPQCSTMNFKPVTCKLAQPLQRSPPLSPSPFLQSAVDTDASPLCAGIVTVPQGYGMSPNLTSWGGNTLMDPISGEFRRPESSPFTS